MRKFIKFISLTLYCGAIGCVSGYLSNQYVFFGVLSESMGTVNAQKYNLLDGNGKIIGTLGSHKNINVKGNYTSFTGLVIFDQNQRPRYLSGVNNIDGYPLTLHADPNGLPKLVTGLDENNYPYIFLYQSSINPHMAIYTNIDGPMVTFWDENSIARLNIFNFRGNSGFQTFDKFGEKHWSQSTNKKSDE